MSDLQLPDGLEVIVLLGSISDRAVAEEMLPVFCEFGITAHVAVCSAHRDHERLGRLIPEAESKGCVSVIAVAGKSAHLPGVCAALTTMPVIGVPAVNSGIWQDSLYSIVNMPPGIPVACVGMDAGRNAALLAVQQVAIGRSELRAKLKEFRDRMRESNRRDSAKLQQELSGK
ncbi:MAG: 5-(carboxyamino)imidazole ribonucleotide mutase [bacterium]